MRTLLKKSCTVCQVEFKQPKTCSMKEWNIRRFCSNVCRNIGAKGRSNSPKTQFKKGQFKGYTPWNKGLKQTPEHRAKVIKTLVYGVITHGLSKSPEYARWSTHKRRFYKKLPEGEQNAYTIKQWEALKAKYNHMCLCCKQQEPFIKLSVDHVIPISKGGKNTIENIQPLCMSCNNQKYVKVIDYRELFNDVNK